MRGTSLINKIQSKRVQGVLKHGCSPDLRKNTGVARYKRDLKEKNNVTIAKQCVHLLFWDMSLFNVYCPISEGYTNVRIIIQVLRPSPFPRPCCVETMFDMHTSTSNFRKQSKSENHRSREQLPLGTRSCLQTMVSGYKTKN